jgi:phosphoserine phosphatase
MEFERLKKEKNPVLAVCYDFDRTLTPDDMQAQGFIQSVGADVKEFWQASNALAKKSDMDNNLAYMYLMVQSSIGKFYLTKDALNDYGAKIKLYRGVKDWFSRLNAYGRELGVTVEHYVISSGLREMIEGTPIAKEFKKIYASAFCFDEKGVPVWPAQTINYTNKTQFLFRIEKGCLDINDHEGVNEYFGEDKLRVPLRNFVYLGDSETDIPCMKLVSSAGGHAVGVYDPRGNKEKVFDLMKNNRIRYFAPADYSEGSELDSLLKAIIEKTAKFEELQDKHVRNMIQTRAYFANKS